MKLACENCAKAKTLDAIGLQRIEICSFKTTITSRSLIHKGFEVPCEKMRTFFPGSPKKKKY